MPTKRSLPLLGIALAVPLFGIAMACYPGGSHWDADAPGFRFTANYVSALFQPLAINGEPNAARPFAIPAMLSLCAGAACMFWAVSRRCDHRLTRKVVEVFGVGAMVYTFLGVCTPMHDLLVVLAALFYALAGLGMLFVPQVAARPASRLAGVLCLLLLAALAAMRHGGLPAEHAPLTEWLLFAAAIGWLSFVYATGGPGGGAAAAAAAPAPAPPQRRS